MSDPLISIVICCYNRCDFLPKTLETVFEQKYQPVEIVVVDDGSTDGTPDLFSSYGDRVRYFHQENQGIAAARTSGCKLAKGKFIAFQDDDDLMPPDRIVNLLDGMSRYPSAVLALGDYAFIDSDGELTGKKSSFSICTEKNNSTKNPIFIPDGYYGILWPKVTPLPHTTLFRKSDAERIGWFDPNFFHACSDTDFFARLGQLGPIVYVPQVVSYYRQGHSSIWEKKLTAEYSRLLLLEKHIKLAGPSRKELQSHLQDRLLLTLNRIAHLKSNDKLSEFIPNDYLTRGLSILRLKDRLAYRWYSQIRLPLRKLLLGH